MKITKALINGLQWPRGATHMKLECAGGKWAVADRKSAGTSFDGTDGTVTFGAMVPVEGKRGKKEFSPLANGLVSEVSQESVKDAAVAPGESKPVKASKVPKVPKVKDEEPADRLPVNVDELKETKGGLVTFLHLSGKDKPAIITELMARHQLTEAQSAKIVRRITGRVRFFQRAFALIVK